MTLNEQIEEINKRIKVAKKLLRESKINEKKVGMDFYAGQLMFYFSVKSSLEKLKRLGCTK